jgi:hypothetical protein
MEVLGICVIIILTFVLAAMAFTHSGIIERLERPRRERLPDPDHMAVRNRDWDDEWEVSEGHSRNP